MATITVDHEEADLIMEWLYENYHVSGDEDDLVGEPLIYLICESGYIDLDIYLSKRYDTSIDLRRDIKFITSEI